MLGRRARYLSTKSSDQSPTIVNKHGRNGWVNWIYKFNFDWLIKNETCMDDSGGKQSIDYNINGIGGWKGISCVLASLCLRLERACYINRVVTSREIKSGRLDRLSTSTDSKSRYRWMMTKHTRFTHSWLSFCEVSLCSQTSTPYPATDNSSIYLPYLLHIWDTPRSRSVGGLEILLLLT